MPSDSGSSFASSTSNLTRVPAPSVSSSMILPEECLCSRRSVSPRRPRSRLQSPCHSLALLELTFVELGRPDAAIGLSSFRFGIFLLTICAAKSDPTRLIALSSRALQRGVGSSAMVVRYALKCCSYPRSFLR